MRPDSKFSTFFIKQLHKVMRAQGKTHLRKEHKICWICISIVRLISNTLHREYQRWSLTHRFSCLSRQSSHLELYCCMQNFKCKSNHHFFNQGGLWKSENWIWILVLQIIFFMPFFTWVKFMCLYIYTHCCVTQYKNKEKMKGKSPRSRRKLKGELLLAQSSDYHGKGKI